MNTLITLASVWVMHQLLDWNLELSNFLGFIFGAINSYLMNRIWNFKSWCKPFTDFISQYMKPGFFANIVANGVYIIASFTLYKKWVFKK